MAFLVVNNKNIELSDALDWSAVSDSHPFREATIERVVLHQYAESQGLDVTSEEVQRESDRVRFALDLSDPDDTAHWLKNQGLTMEAFAKACAHSVLRKKVRASIPDDTVENYYAEHQDEFTDVDLYVIRQRNVKKLSKLADQLRDGKANFHLEAMSQSEDPHTAPQGGYVGRMRRDEVPEDLAVSVFSVDPGDIIGPVTDQDGHILMLVKNVEALPLDAVREEIRDIVFGEMIGQLTTVAVVSGP